MNIRNFCIIAHIDHGKSTLADRMLELTDTVRKSEKTQVLDRMDLEQERGITIKLTPVRMQYKGYEFNLIDTPGHVDFQYEVSRSLAAVQGAILLVDASQGIQAQTLSVLYQAIDQGLDIIPVLNKIDLPAANPERVGQEIENVIGIDRSEIISVSGKTGQNVDLLLDAIIERFPDPISFIQKHPKKYRSSEFLSKTSSEALRPQGVLAVPARAKRFGETSGGNLVTLGNSGTSLTRALIFDSVFDPYKGVVSYVSVLSGTIKKDTELYLIHSDNHIRAIEVGHFSPDYVSDKELSAGQIGYIVTGEKSVREAQIGDTMVDDKGCKRMVDDTKILSIPGFKEVKPFVFSGVFPIETTDYDKLKDSMEKLTLNDSAIQYTMEDSKALGLGFRCGFLGMLHMDIIKERLHREYDIDTIFTIPTVAYLVKSKNLNLTQIKSGSNISTLVKSGLYKHIIQIEEKTNTMSSGSNVILNGVKNPSIQGSSTISSGSTSKEAISHIHPDLSNKQIHIGKPSAISSSIDDMSESQIIEQYHDVLNPRLLARSGSDMIEQGRIQEIYEPVSIVEVVGPQEYAGSIMELCQDCRGALVSMDYIDSSRVVWKYNIPMGEIVVDFYDRLKSITKGFATMNYEFKGYEKSDLVKLDIMINGEVMESFSMIVHKDKAYHQGRILCEKLKDLIPKHLFSIPIQAAIGGKIIARETISAMKKDVIAKCYGGDVSRKRKLLQKQKEGKKKMKSIGSVNIPSDTFIKIVKR